MSCNVLCMDFDLPLKGNRDYIQSADIFDAVTPELFNFLEITNSDSWHASFTYRSFVRSRIRVLFADHPKIEFTFKKVDLCGQIFVRCESERRLGYILKDNSAVHLHKPDFEDELLDKVIFADGMMQSSAVCKEMTITEVAVALTKSLHQKTISNEVKWIATQLQLPLTFSSMNAENIGVRIVKNHNNTTTLTSVLCNNVVVGSIRFNAISMANA